VTAFDVISTTTRGGIDVEEIAIAGGGGAVGTGYLLGRSNDEQQPIVVALHHERGDKATLLPDLEHLAARGFLCLSVDSPVTRRASSARDWLEAFDSELELAVAALDLLQHDPDAQRSHTALLGRGIGGEVAAAVAATTGRAQVVVAIAPLPDRSEFVRSSPHPLAAGLRQFHDEDRVTAQVAGLKPLRLVDQLDAGTDTNWLVQVADDDDRLSDQDHATLSLAIPRVVRVHHVTSAADLGARQARRTRIDFITRLCR